MILNVKDFDGDIQKTIDLALASKAGKVYIPSGTYELSAGLIIPRPLNNEGLLTPGVELEGDGISNTIIYTNNPNIDVLTIQRSNTSIKNIRFQGSQTQGQGRGIVISDPTNGVVLGNIHLEDLYISATSQHALFIPDGYPHLLGEPFYDQISILCSYERCVFDSNVSEGSDLVYVGKWNTTHRFDQCNFSNFKGFALNLHEADAVGLTECIFEAGDNTKAYVNIDGCTAGHMNGCYFEDHDEGPAKTRFVSLDMASHGWGIDHCTFRRHGGRDPRALVVGGNSQGITIIAPHMVTLGGLPNQSSHILITGNDTVVHVMGGSAQGPQGVTQVRVQDDSLNSTTLGVKKYR